jgi:hypothetical protein
LTPVYLSLWNRTNSLRTLNQTAGVLKVNNVGKEVEKVRKAGKVRRTGTVRKAGMVRKTGTARKAGMLRKAGTVKKAGMVSSEALNGPGEDKGIDIRLATHGYAVIGPPPLHTKPN